MDMVPDATRASDASVSMTEAALEESLPLTLTRWRHGTAELTFEGSKAACIILNLSDQQRVERLQAGVWSTKPCGIGLVTVTDPEELTRFTIRGDADVLLLQLSTADLGITVDPTRRPRVRARFNEADQELARCGIRALVALHNGENLDRLFVSSMALRLSSGLIDRPYQDVARASGGLSSRQVRRVKEVIAAHVAAPVASSPKLADLASEANLSQYHFAREFRRTVGVAPYRYLLCKRLERARGLVIQSDLEAAEIAHRCGFASAAHFADRFRREFGVTPTNLRRAVRG